MALSGIDLALWDMLGKAQGRPVYDLLGGLAVDRVRAYATSKEFERDRDTGYTAVKVGTAFFGHDGEADRIVSEVAAARETYGPDALVMTDCGMTWNGDDALDMADRLADYDVYWFEDVLTPDHLDELAALRPRVKPVLLVGGEHNYTHHDFAAIAEAGALDLWQPDITWCGGITAGLRILELARDAGDARGAAPRGRDMGAAPAGRHRLRRSGGDDAPPLVSAPGRAVVRRAPPCERVHRAAGQARLRRRAERGNAVGGESR